MDELWLLTFPLVEADLALKLGSLAPPVDEHHVTAPRARCRVPTHDASNDKQTHHISIHTLLIVGKLLHTTQITQSKAIHIHILMQHKKRREDSPQLVSGIGIQDDEAGRQARALLRGAAAVWVLHKQWITVHTYTTMTMNDNDGSTNHHISKTKAQQGSTCERHDERSAVQGSTVMWIIV